MTRQCSHWASGKRKNLDSALVSQQQASLRWRDIINSHFCRCTVSGGQSVLAECHMLCGVFGELLGALGYSWPHSRALTSEVYAS